MSPSMALRRSPKPGALTAHKLGETPRSRFTTKAARRFILDILGDDQQMACHYPLHGVEQRQEIRPDWRSSFRGCRMHAVFEHALGRLRIGHEVRTEVALVKSHAFDVVQRGIGRLAFLHSRQRHRVQPCCNSFGNERRRFRCRDWLTPWRSSAKIIPCRGNAVAVSSTGDTRCLEAALLMPRCMTTALAASSHMTKAFAVDRLDAMHRSGPWCRRRRGRPSSWRPDGPSERPCSRMSSDSSISLETDTPSLVTAGLPHDFWTTTLRPLGPIVDAKRPRASWLDAARGNPRERRNRISFA